MLTRIRRSHQIAVRLLAAGCLALVLGSASSAQNLSCPVTTDVASFSSGAEGLSHLKAKLEGVPEVRQQRVDQLRSALAQGNYPISPEHIAQAMLADAVRKLG